YDATTTKQPIALNEYRILTVAFAPDSQTFATGGTDRIVRVWDCSTGVVLHTFRGHAGSVQSVVFAHGGEGLLSGGRDGSLNLWTLELGAELATVPTRFTPVNCLAVSPDGRWLAVASGPWMPDPSREGRGEVTILDLGTLTAHRVFKWDMGLGAVAFQ